jgi:hypothetical protein
MKQLGNHWDRRRRLTSRQKSACWFASLGTVLLLIPSAGLAANGSTGATGATGPTATGALTGASGQTGSTGATGAKGASGAAPACATPLNHGASAPTLSQDIELTPAPGSAQRNMNFGSSRERKIVKGVRFEANKKLPDSLSAQQLSFDALLSRASDKSESMDFPDPTFTGPKILPDRKSIKFDICLSPGSIPPDKYSGSVTLSGPAGLTGASVLLTANVKRTFWWYWMARVTIALLLAFFLLVLKDAAAYKKDHPNDRWRWKPWKDPLGNPVWWTTTIVALGGAFGVLYAVYAGDPAWGSGGFEDFAAMIGAAFAAVGGHTIITTLSP